MKLFTRFIWRSLWLSILFLLPGFSPAGQPTEQLQTTITQVIDLIKQRQSQPPVTQQKTTEAIKAAISARFDYVEMSRIALGTHWATLSPSQQQEFSALFQKLLEQLYLQQMQSYAGETVTYQQEIIAPNGDKAKVSTTITRSTGQVPVVYSLMLKNMPTGPQWQVYDMQVEGIRLVQNYRTHFNEILSKEGYTALLKQIQDKINTIQQSPTTPPLS